MTRTGAIAAGLLMALTACSEPPAGEPVVRANLDGTTPAEQVAAPSPAPSITAVDSACRAAIFEDVPLSHCIADPAAHRIAMVNAPAGGQPYGSMSAFAASADAGTIAFAMNGGAYGDDLKAVGYYVENGERLSDLDRGDGEGNFYMKPNGVFFGTGATWRVLASDSFFATVGERPEFGTQSARCW